MASSASPGRPGLPNNASGTLTSAAPVGKVVTRGETLYWLGNRPVVLFYGRLPQWREAGANSLVARTGGDTITDDKRPGNVGQPARRRIGRWRPWPNDRKVHYPGAVRAR